jgi:lysophospholipase L1-like esterase
MINFLYFFLIFIVLEIFIYFVIYLNKKNFQWLITKSDDFPDFKQNNIDNFFKKSFDKDLGWKKKPYAIGFHDNRKKTKFSIDKLGARKSRYEKFKKKIEAYGDSFVFGRYVNDENVWTEILSKNLNCHVMNYGVGNYGFDQALLRHKKNDIENSIYTIIGFVPETINRINSIWKHYLEFGNIYGFKPTFFIKNEKLILKKNPILNKNQFNKRKIIKIIKFVSDHDFFYLKKFKKFQFRRPYLLSFFRNFNFNCKLFAKIFFFYFQNKKDKKNFIFPLYYENNIEFANKLYLEEKSTKLFRLLIQRFKNNVKKKNSIPVIIVFPQRRDIELFRKNKNHYCDFFNSIEDVKIIDLTKYLSNKDLKKIYLDEEHGGHLTNYGNKVVSKKIQEVLKNDRH